MKKVLGILLAVFLCLGIASTSMATGGVETSKAVMIFAGAFLCTNTAAESDAITLQGNIGTLDGADYIYHHGLYRPESNASITGSVTGNAGLTAVNNASGNLNNQGNTLAVTTAGYDANGLASDNGGTPSPKGALSHAVAFAFQGNILNGYFSTKKFANATITDSVIDNDGIVGVNNAGGSQNNQTNTVALAAGLNTSIALGEATLAQTNVLGFVCNTASVNTASISGSINTNHGVVGVNNSAGAQNNQANVVAVAGNHP